MNQYISDTEYAVSNLLELAHQEEAILQQKTAELASVEAEYKIHSWDFETSDLNDDFSDAYVMGAFSRMASVADKAVKLRPEINALQALVGAHQVAIQAICGSVLQIAKQGISLVHGDLHAAPTGRLVGSIPVRDIIWQARNQSMHYEEGNLRKAVTDLFADLELAYGSSFSLSLHPLQSRAKQVIQLIEWKSFNHYRADMELILP